MDNHSIRELSESDWAEYKAIRLRSLQDSPDSFVSTYERESKFQTEQWKARLRVSPSIHDAVVLAAVVGDTYVGLLSCVIQRPGTRSAHLNQMWVAPEYRGCGIGMALVKKARKWVYKRSIGNLLLSVVTVNAAAISLYQNIGFKPIGETELLRPGSSLESQIMEAKLNENDS